MKSRPKFRSDRSGPSQGDLLAALDQPTVIDSPNAADLDIGPELLGAINTAIREARARGLSRERIVDRMNLALPERAKAVTLRQLNAWTAASAEFHEIPARYVPAFCWATSSDAPLRVIANVLGLDLVDGREAAAKRLGDNLVAEVRLKRERRVLTQVLGG